MKKISGNAVVPPSEDLGPVPDLRWIEKDLIVVDKRYQREIGTAGTRHVNGILRDFKWQFFQVVTVTPRRDGKFVAIDGQHRWLAAMRHPKVTKLPCVVIDQIDVQQQARVFEALNGNRLAITALQRFHVAIAASEPGAMRVDYVCAEAGVTILKAIPQGPLPPLSLTCVATVAKFRKHSDLMLISVLTAMVTAWPDKVNGFRAANVAASLLCATELGNRYSQQAMIAMLRGWNEHEEFLRAYTERTEKGGILERLLAKRMVERFGQVEARTVSKAA